MFMQHKGIINIPFKDIFPILIIILIHNFIQMIQFFKLDCYSFIILLISKFILNLLILDQLSIIMIKFDFIN
jgi:hypothetical protein